MYKFLSCRRVAFCTPCASCGMPRYTCILPTLVELKFVQFKLFELILFVKVDRHSALEGTAD